MGRATDEMYQKASGQADEMIAEKGNKRTGPQMNIGPNMGREDKASKKTIEKEADKYLGTSKSDVSAAIDAYKKGSDRAKMDAQAIGMKKGGSVKSSASSRADGCAVRGKTRA